MWESIDGGNNFTQVGANLGANESVVSLVSGGQVGANNFPNVLFVGTDNPAIYRRPAAGGGLTQLTGYGGGTPWDLAMDPLNWASLFAVDITNSRIWRSINADNANAANVAFANITANLMAVAGANFGAPDNRIRQSSDGHRPAARRRAWRCLRDTRIGCG